MKQLLSIFASIMIITVLSSFNHVRTSNVESFNNWIPTEYDYEWKETNYYTAVHYMIAEGDTWYGLGKKFNIDYRKLAYFNNRENSKLAIGEIIIIPEQHFAYGMINHRQEVLKQAELALESLQIQ